MTQTSKAQTKLQQLTAVLENHKTMLIVLQDNPDPDAIASAMALRKLANTLANIQCSVAHGGTVGRAENRALVKYLNINLRPLNQIDMKQFELFAMVDTQPGTGNNSLPGQVEPDIVIDHHACKELTRHCRFTDVRSKYGATATIMLEYLDAANIKPEVPLATAMVYAIRSDTQDLGRDSTKADIEAFTCLYGIANKRMLSEIQRGLVERNYYQMLSDALKNATVYDNAIVTNLGRIENPDMIAEVADMLLRDHQTDWIMVYGTCNDVLMISLRTYRSGGRADKVISKLVARKGTGGGHPSYAGGQISCGKLSEEQIDKLEKTIITRFIREVTENDSKGEKLVKA